MKFRIYHRVNGIINKHQGLVLLLMLLVIYLK